MNILIVDDHAGMRTLIRDMIGGLATQVRECASGEDALEVCEQYSPDLITMDLRMGGMNGLTCVRRVRAQYPATNIAVVTQYDHETLRAQAHHAGADTYILKDDMDALQRFAHVLATGLSE